MEVIGAGDCLQEVLTENERRERDYAYLLVMEHEVRDHYEGAETSPLELTPRSAIFKVILPSGQVMAAKIPAGLGRIAFSRTSFARENQNWEAMKSELDANALSGLVPILDFFPDLPAIVSPHVPYGSLNQHMASFGPNAPTLFILKVLEDIAKILQPLHAKGWAHRDVKPENIFVEELNVEKRRVRLKLADHEFLAREASESEKLPAIGTLTYAPPEVLAGVHVPYRIWDMQALMVVTQELSLGKRIFKLDDSDRTEVTRAGKRIAYKLARKPREIDSRITEGLSELGSKRFATVEEFLRRVRDEIIREEALFNLRRAQ